MKWKILISSLILLILVLISLFVITISAPADFPLGSMHSIKSGSGLSTIALNLASKNIIRSPFWFKSFSVIFGGTKGVVAGDYVLNNRQNTVVIAYRLARGDYELAQVKITLLEGLNILEMSKIVSDKLAKITASDFINKSKGLEGYLFPDTYIFQSNTGIYTVIEAMQANYKKKMLTLNDQMKAFGKPESDIIKMASILEEEARTMESRQIIAGILWKRLNLGMPLQVDASFKYINGKGTKDLSLDDLKIDSPYNSYIYKGLPPTPICNPGLDAIKAALTPIKTAYLYFLTDKEGNMHYAKTYDEHLQNKKLYLE